VHSGGGSYEKKGSDGETRGMKESTSISTGEGKGGGGKRGACGKKLRVRM